MAGAPSHDDDFTEESYRTLLRLARSGYRFETFAAASPGAERRVLWRHDVDLSPHRAARLAEIEHEQAIGATYFFLLHSPFYNLLEKDIAQLVVRIAALGHEIGIHFDPEFYGLAPEDDAALELALTLERRVFADLLGVDVVAFSFHNPSAALLECQRHDAVADLVNAYGPGLRASFSYCSDSNGYWRFRRLHDVLAAAVDERLHVLTHPEWWTPEPMSPRSRVTRAIEGRAARLLRDYDDALAAMGRLNLG